MSIINSIKKFFTTYPDEFYVENIDISEIIMTEDGKQITNPEEILYEYMNDQEEITLLNGKEGFSFVYGILEKFTYKIDFNDYVTVESDLFPKMTVCKGNDNLIIKLYMKHD